MDKRRTMPDRWVLSLATIGFVISSSTCLASVITVSEGTAISVNVRDCRSNSTLTAPDKCILPVSTGDWNGTLVEQADVLNTDGESTLFVTNSLGIVGGDATGGNIVASSPTTSTPEAFIGAFTSMDYARSTAFMTAIQGYEWDGSGSSTRTFNATMTFTSTDPGAFPDADLLTDPASGGSLAVTIFSLSTPNFTADDDISVFASGCYLPTYNPDLCLSLRSDYNLLGFTQVTSDASGISPLLVSLSFDLMEGQVVFVEVFGQAVSRFGTSFDGHITTSFDSFAGLGPVAQVPEPGTMALLLGAGLAGIGFARRRARSFR